SSYERAGVSAISVLTESDFFHGSLDDLREVRRASGLPILRKDFTIDEAQIYEAALAGADAILLIVAALTDPELTSFRATAEALGLDALIEVHTADEMRRAVDLGAELLGVNNRDLFTLQVSVETSLCLAPLAPPGALLISESGLSSLDDFRRLAAVGYRGFLVGESLMRAADPAALLAEWRGLDLQEVSRA
ncbi:MAG: indole-3-glycerol phosphate synthase TrpC, partial [Chthoniobacterales bacterium]